MGGEVEFLGGLTYNPNDVQDTGVLVIRSSNIKNGKIIDADNVYVDEDIAVSTKVEIDDIIVVVRNGSRSLIGKHAVVKDNLNAVIGAFMTVIRVDDADFINAVLDSDKFKSEIAKNLGATINQITTGNFRNMKFNFPASRSEKISIGSFFRQMDDLIAAHERKLDLLKKKRTYYLRQIFSRRLRFRGFTEPWKQRKLGEIFKVSSEKNINLVFRKDDAISVARMRKITAASDSSDDYMKTYNIFRLGDIAYEGNKSKDYAFGRLVMNTIGDGIVSHVFTVYRPKTPIVIPFMSKYIHSEYVMRNILLRSTSKALAMSSLSSKEFLKQSLVFPEMQEEEQIGCFFNILDSYIEFHVRRIDLLKNMKLAYLQKMFV